MSRLKELIAELCPNGVEFVPLWSVTIWDKRFNSVDRKKQNKVINYPYLLAADLFALEADRGDVFLLSTGEQTGWTTEELAGDNLCEGEVVTMPWGKSRAVTDCIKYYKGKFVTADNRIMTSINTDILSNKYLYYWFMSVGNKVDLLYRGSGIKHPDMSKVLDLMIPIPPLPVQQEICRILDSYKELTAELKTKLTAELTNRKKQYDYYKDALLPFNQDNIVWKPLGEICTIVRGASPRPIKNYITKDENGINWIKIGDAPPGAKYITECSEKITLEGAKKSRAVKPGDFILSNSMSFGRPYILQINGCIHDGWLAISAFDNHVSSDYLYYILTSSYIQRIMKQKASFGGAVQNLNADIVRAIEIPLISKKQQEIIVSQLDRVSMVYTAIIDNLPAEIAARQKQYEYYRDKLLTFKEQK